MAMRAVAVMAWAVSGCTMGESDVFTIYPDGGGECWVDEDCPRVECHRAPTCNAGICRTLAQEKPTMCSLGVCTGDAVCVPCEADAVCEAVNTNECYSLACGENGKCFAIPLAEGSRCNFTPDSVCTAGNNCSPTE